MGIDTQHQRGTIFGGVGYGGVTGLWVIRGSFLRMRRGVENELTLFREKMPVKKNPEIREISSTCHISTVRPPFTISGYGHYESRQPSSARC